MPKKTAEHNEFCWLRVKITNIRPFGFAELL